jgi:hypothetical protein
MCHLICTWMLLITVLIADVSSYLYAYISYCSTTFAELFPDTLKWLDYSEQRQANGISIKDISGFDKETHYAKGNLSFGVGAG